jgi:hypothetical protein
MAEAASQPVRFRVSPFRQRDLNEPLQNLKLSAFPDDFQVRPSWSSRRLTIQQMLCGDPAKRSFDPNSVESNVNVWRCIGAPQGEGPYPYLPPFPCPQEMRMEASPTAALQRRLTSGRSAFLPAGMERTPERPITSLTSRMATRQIKWRRASASTALRRIPSSCRASSLRCTGRLLIS